MPVKQAVTLKPYVNTTNRKKVINLCMLAVSAYASRNNTESQKRGVSHFPFTEEHSLTLTADTKHREARPMYVSKDVPGKRTQ